MSDKKQFWIPGYEKRHQASFPVKQSQLYQKIKTYEETGFAVVGIEISGEKEYTIYVISL